MIVNLFDLLLDAGSESPYKTFFITKSPDMAYMEVGQIYR